MAQCYLTKYHVDLSEERRKQHYINKRYFIFEYRTLGFAVRVHSHDHAFLRAQN